MGQDDIELRAKCISPKAKSVLLDAIQEKRKGRPGSGATVEDMVELVIKNTPECHMEDK